MRKNIADQKKDLLKIIHGIITNQLQLTESNGLVNGQSGVALFMYKYSQYKNDQEMLDIAHSIINNYVWGPSLASLNSTNFTYGKTGFSWLFQHLIDINIITSNTQIENVLIELDRSIIYHRLQTPLLVDIKSDLFSHGLALIKRYKGFDHYNNESEEGEGQNLYLYKLTLREQIIYLIDECERLLYDKTAFNNILKPNWSLRLLNSILFFLIQSHKYNIFPSKTIKLIVYIIEIQKKLLPTCNILELSEIFAFYSLTNSIRSVLPQISKYDNSISPAFTVDTENISSEILIEVLSNAGFYTIIFENKDIFNETLSYLCSQDNSLVKKLCKHLKKNKNNRMNLSLDGLSSIGYGIISILN